MDISLWKQCTAGDFLEEVVLSEGFLNGAEGVPLGQPLAPPISTPSTLNYKCGFI